MAPIRPQARDFDKGQFYNEIQLEQGPLIRCSHPVVNEELCPRDYSTLVMTTMKAFQTASQVSAIAWLPSKYNTALCAQIWSRTSYKGDRLWKMNIQQMKITKHRGSLSNGPRPNNPGIPVPARQCTDWCMHGSSFLQYPWSCQAFGSHLKHKKACLPQIVCHAITRDNTGCCGITRDVAVCCGVLRGTYWCLLQYVGEGHVWINFRSTHFPPLFS